MLFFDELFKVWLKHEANVKKNFLTNTQYV